MLNKIHLFGLFVAWTMFITSCGQAVYHDPEPSKTQKPQIVSLAQTLVSNEDYLAGCKAINPTELKEQVSYRNILPGKTSVSELAALLGKPDTISKYKDSTSWIYDETGFFIKNDIVNSLIVSFEEGGAEQTLKDIILEYGCPSIVFAVNNTEDQVGYNTTQFTYLNGGIEFRFAYYPTSLAETTRIVSYFQPMQLDEYTERYVVVGIHHVLPIDWSEAVR